MTPEDRIDRYYGILLSGFLSLVLSGFFTLIALGLSREWLVAWGTGFVLGWPLAVGIVALFVSGDPKLHRSGGRKCHTRWSCRAGHEAPSVSSMS